MPLSILFSQPRHKEGLNFFTVSFNINKETSCNSRSSKHVLSFLSIFQKQEEWNICCRSICLTYNIEASLYIYHFSTVVDFSSVKHSGSTGHRNSRYQQRNLQ